MEIFQKPEDPPSSSHTKRIISNIKVFSGSSHLSFAKSIVDYLNINLGDVDIIRFGNLEVETAINETVAGEDVFIVQTGGGNVNDSFMELLFMIHACKLASSSRVTAVIPYFPYGRQDQKHRGGISIAAKLLANMLTMAGANHIITMDLHTPQIQGFFDIPIDNLLAETTILEWIKGNILDWKNSTIMSSHGSGIQRAIIMADKLNVDFGVVHSETNETIEEDTMVVVGKVKGKNIILIDDIVDTGATICRTAKVLVKAGATKVYGILTHGIFSGSALSHINEAPFEQVVVTNTIFQDENMKNCSRLQCIDVSKIFAEAVKRTHNKESLSPLFSYVPY